MELKVPTLTRDLYSDPGVIILDGIERLLSRILKISLYDIDNP